MPENVFTYLDGAVQQPSRQRTLNALPGDGRNFDIIRFPAALGAREHSIPFTIFMPYKRKLFGFYSIENQNLYKDLPPPTFAIALPTPTSALKAVYQTTYNEVSLGQAAGAAGVAGLAGIKNVTAATDLESKIKAGLSAAASVVVGVGSALAAGAVQGMMKEIGADKQIPNIAAGVTDNPFTENMFQNVGFREHIFTYTFMPKNSQDSKDIDRIITLFKYGMLPKPATVDFFGTNPGAGFLEFPYEFQITHSVQDTTFTLLPSVLTTLDVDYGGGADSPKLFRPDMSGGQYPVKITLSMTFKEMVLLTRDRVMYDSLYGNDGKPPDDNVKRYRF